MYSRTFLFLICLLCATTLNGAQKFLSDDPLLLDQDRIVDVGTPLRRGLSDYYDFLQHTFATPGELKPTLSQNANTLGEVPDSSWFQNRHASKRMTIEEIVRGPNTNDGPSNSSPWKVIEGKTEGITPGFRVRDSRGDVYVIKFDPPDNPEMATAAEIISTKLFFAAGYNVPENHLVFFTRESLVVDSSAKISVGLGPRRQMSESDLDEILARVYKFPDGRYRAVASKFLAGRPIGPFKYYGTRSDDANDVIPHEHRRELRGLRVLSAWLNHDDSRAVNTLDTVETENGRAYIRHHLIDFGSTLGSGSVQAQKPRAGWEYIWEPAPAFRRIFTLGLWDSSWIRVHYPDMPSIGRFESNVFDPEQWKPEYPNPAFMNASAEDNYWGAKIAMAFTDEEIRAVVRAGGLSDPTAEAYMIDTLIERRNKIGQHYFKKVLPIDHFKLDGSFVRFEDLSLLYRLSESSSPYTLGWFRFDNDKEAKTFVGEKLSSREPGRIEIPRDLLNGTEPYFGVEIQSDSRKATVFIRR